MRLRGGTERSCIHYSPSPIPESKNRIGGVEVLGMLGGLMFYYVTVAFGKDKEHQYKFSSEDLAESSPDEARRWFDREFSELKSDPVNPVGKVLIIDKILDVARGAGEQRFADGQMWAAKFARYTALALGRDMVRVDVAAYAISY